MRVVYWGTYDTGKPRTRILLRGLRENGVDVTEIHADVWSGVEDKSGVTGSQRLRLLLRWLCAYPALVLRYLRAPRHDAVVVGYPGYLDVLVFWPIALLKRRPILWDAFMSLYETVVEDRRLIAPRSLLARLVFALEWLACRAATVVVLDTRTHAQSFAERYRLSTDRVSHVFVGAEPEAFPSQPPDASNRSLGQRPRVLFYGQFIPLHGIDTIMQAALSADGADFDWVVIGSGQEEAKIWALVGDRLPSHVEWIPWIDYEGLKDYIHKADVCLGVFGATEKAAQVIPNKVFQALSTGKPLVTRDSPAVRELLSEDMEGIYLVPPADSTALLAALRSFVKAREDLVRRQPLHRGIADRITPRAVGSNFQQLVARIAGKATSLAAYSSGAVATSSELLMDFAKLLVERLKLSILHLLLAVERVRRFVRPVDPAILWQSDGDIPSGSRRTLCVFAHYDRDNVIDDYVVYYLNALKDTGCETVFVTTAAGIAETEIDKIRSCCSTIIVRENAGHDFGSWKAGLQSVTDFRQYDRLVIANDSVYGPIHDLSEAFERMRESGADFWGITDSRCYSHHLQSYFVVFERRVLESEAFARFWRTYPHYKHKNAVVLAGEVNLSRTLTRAGFRFRALCPSSEVRQSHYTRHQPALFQRSRRRNPSHWFWDTLVLDFGCPFLKVQLLRDNPKQIGSVDRWGEVIRQGTKYDTTLIQRHLSRVKASSG